MGLITYVLCVQEVFINLSKKPMSLMVIIYPKFDLFIFSQVDQFFEYVKNMTKVYATNNVIVTMGNDFNYQDAHTWFKNLDKLIL